MLHDEDLNQEIPLRNVCVISQASHHPGFKAAGFEAIEGCKVCVHIDRETMRGHPMSHADADGADLLFSEPNAGRAFTAHALEMELAEHADRDLLEFSQIAM